MSQKGMIYQKPSSDNCLSLSVQAYIFGGLERSRGSGLPGRNRDIFRL